MKREREREREREKADYEMISDSESTQIKGWFGDQNNGHFMPACLRAHQNVVETP